MDAFILYYCTVVEPSRENANGTRSRCLFEPVINPNTRGHTPTALATAYGSTGVGALLVNLLFIPKEPPLHQHERTPCTEHTTTRVPYIANIAHTHTQAP